MRRSSPSMPSARYRSQARPALSRRGPRLHCVPRRGRAATTWHHLSRRTGLACPGRHRVVPPGREGRASTVKVGIPREVKNHEYRVAITPAGVHELVRNGHEVFVETGRRRRLLDHRRRLRRRRRARSCRRRRRRLGHRRPDPQGQGADRRGVPPHARGPDPVHLPAPGRRPARCTEALLPAQGRPASPTRPSSCRTARCRCWRRCPRSPAGWRRRSARTTLHAGQGGRGVLMGGVSGVYAAKVVVIGAGVSGHERRRDRARHAGRGAAARPQHRPAAPDRPRSTRATCRPSRPTPTRSSGPCWTPTWSSARCWCPGAKAPDAGHQRAGVADEAGQRAGRHLDRPGRLLRGLAGRPRTPTRPTGCTTRCSTASPTCPARCRTPRPTR